MHSIVVPQILVLHHNFWIWIEGLDSGNPPKLAMHFIVISQILVLHHMLSHLGGVNPGDEVLQCSWHKVGWVQHSVKPTSHMALLNQLNGTFDTFSHLRPDHQNWQAATAEAASSHFVTILQAPLCGNDSNIPEFFKERSRHIHSVRGCRIQVLDLSHNFSDFSGQLVVQSIVFPLLDAVPPHNLHLVQVVAHLPVDKVNLPQQLLLMELQFSHHFEAISLS